MPKMTLIGPVYRGVFKNRWGCDEGGSNNLYQCPICRAVKLKEEIFGTENAPDCDRCGP